MTHPTSGGTSSAQMRLYDRLTELGIKAQTVDYPAHQSIDEGKALRGSMSGTFTKNLLLRDKKGKHFLLSVHEDRQLALKTLHKRLGARGQLAFASGKSVMEYLGVAPGALTPLGLINDSAAAVTAVIDAQLMQATQVNFHPLVNTRSTGIHPNELVRFIRSCGRDPLIIDFDEDVVVSGTAQD